MLQRFLRTTSLVLFAVLGTSTLMYFAPGYFSDAQEMDAVHGKFAERSQAKLREEQGSIMVVFREQVLQWSHGDLGSSRQFELPVSTLIRNTFPASLQLLVTAVCSGWLLALTLSVPVSFLRSSILDLTVAVFTTGFLAIPVSALAILCLISDHDSPALILGLILGVRDLKVLHRSLRLVWQEPSLLYARAQGFSALRILFVHVFPMLRRELLSIGLMSFTLALSALIPIEVVFDRSGVGKLAWTAAMNRDLPVLSGVTALLAASVGLLSMFCDADPARKGEPCAE